MISGSRPGKYVSAIQAKMQLSELMCFCICVAVVGVRLQAIPAAHERVDLQTRDKAVRPPAGSEPRWSRFSCCGDLRHVKTAKLVEDRC